MKKRVAILASGGGSNMVALVRSMRGDHPARPVLVMSNDPNAKALRKAADMGIAVDAVDHRPFQGDRQAFETALMAPILAAQADIICLAGFMRVLTPFFVERFQDKMLNIHPSLLPRHKGLNTHQRAIDDGDEYAGCSVHLVTPELDDGPLLGQSRLKIWPQDTASTLAMRVLKLEHALYPTVLERFARGDQSPLILS